ncbi:uncharacterized protein FRV6_11735 [Fusarium oxysporum]|uniref:Uncharacterized protein n=1 Tax=Fusarium oxysporum TaxID=5507 RepID=A0A2H3TFX3_FUSOX|nr:uncharacterized protein FRV6_11735 [Fusarium oxysporum]
MADPMGAEIVVEQDAPFSTPKRPSRVVNPTSKVRDTARQLEDTAIETRRNTRQTTRNIPAEEQINRPIETRRSSGSGSGSGSSNRRAMLQKALDLLAESRRETKRLQEALKEQIEITRELREAIIKQEEIVYKIGYSLPDLRDISDPEANKLEEPPAGRAAPDERRDATINHRAAIKLRAAPGGRAMIVEARQEKAMPAGKGPRRLRRIYLHRGR